ncbi:ferrous iron transport protein B [Polymorphobacter multimanifer]|uniref:Fe(2+) transporter FeoB n=1 Tax=Polymorphobacter multimanifer TaxID=1070431 RepID=A0A841LBE0_9SPHN|nr:ferrous iron transporter B [Polymorphobacter multimanifer]MBB6227135.1 ferrous iron transport protein B [Polymorphobacter multimanifer]
MNVVLASPVVALVGNPNAGKTSLFNALTGSRQKVGNYPGVTVERKAGRLPLADGRSAELIDLPGTYSLEPRSPDEAVTRDAVLGRLVGERPIDAIIAVVDATNLRNHLRFALELKALGKPMVVALNMIDLADRDGIEIDVAALEELLGLPVVPTVAVRRRGLEALAAAVSSRLATPATEALVPDGDIAPLQREARRIATAAVRSVGAPKRWSERIDGVALHPVAGPLLLAGLLFFIFQAVFAWAEAPMGWIEALIGAGQDLVNATLDDGPLRSMLVNGVLAGVGAVIIFLPQILILFFFILLLEQSGYMVRAAFIMDRLMAGVGLNGRAFIPLLSSFACAIPGIMAARTIDSPKDRLTTILIAPLMTCSARLPVYAVIIAAFIPATQVGGLFNLQGLVLTGLYLFGVIGALVAAAALRRTVTRGPSPSFLMEMPKYQWPAPRDVGIGLYQRATAFLVRAGTIILVSTIVLWGLASYPKPPANWEGTALDYSLAGRIGDAIEPIFAPIGFNREIAIALVPGMAAREVAVSALATVYALEGVDEENTDSLVETLRGRWELPTALAFLAWFVFAPQCISTLAVTKRETGGWRWPIFMFSYLFAAAWLAAGFTYWTARALL